MMKFRASLKYLIVIICIFLFNMPSVNANDCGVRDSVVLCNYKQGSHYIFVSACYEDEKTVDHYYFAVRNGNDESSAAVKFLYYSPSAVSTGSKVNKGSSYRLYIDSMHISGPAYETIQTLAKNPPSASDANSSCPQYVAASSDFESICIVQTTKNGPSFCAGATIYGKSIEFPKVFKQVKNNGGFSDAVLKDKQEYSSEIFQAADHSVLTELGKASCDTLLGSTSAEAGDPAYYLNLVFEVMKYLAIIALVIFTGLDFFKAIVAKDDDQLKLASSKGLKRLMLCVLIFFLPVLIQLVMVWAGIVDSPSLCGVGG